MNANIRMAQRSDCKTMSSIHKACFEKGWSEEDISEMLEQSFALISRDDDTDTGFIICRPAADESEIISMGVLENYRTKGIAKELLLKAIAESQKNGSKFMHLEVREDNIAASKLYKSCGFSVARERLNYYKVGDKRYNAILMTLQIPHRNM